MPKKTYNHIFFDLDRTLWDFERNSHEALSELYLTHKLEEAGIHDFEHFILRYRIWNEMFWEQYRKGQIEKEELRYVRFHETFKEFGINDVTLAKRLAEGYLQLSPRKTNLRPFTIEILEYLQDKYHLHIITNGFDEVQHIKLDNSGLKPFFKEVVTSDIVGYKKPAPQIFTYSLKKAGAKRKDSIMIGDNLQADLIGAKLVGIDQVFYNIDGIKHEEWLTHEITCLSELKNIL